MNTLISEPSGRRLPCDIRLRRMMQRTGIDRVPIARAVEVLAALHVTCADCPNVQQCAL